MKGLIYMLPESVMWKKVFVKIKQNSRRICVILFDKLVGLQPANPESPTPVRPGRRGGGGCWRTWLHTHPPTMVAVNTFQSSMAPPFWNPFRRPWNLFKKGLWDGCFSFFKNTFVIGLLGNLLLFSWNFFLNVSNKTQKQPPEVFLEKLLLKT